MNEIAFQIGERVHHFLRFYALDNDLHLHILEHFYGVLQEYPHLGIMLFVNERFVELDDLKRQLNNALHIRVACAVIVERERQPRA